MNEEETQLQEQLRAITPDSILNEIASLAEEAKGIKAGYLTAKKSRDERSIDMLLRRVPVVDLPNVIAKLAQAMYGALYVVFHKFSEIDSSIDALERGVVQELDNEGDEEGEEGDEEGDEFSEDDEGGEYSEEDIAAIRASLAQANERIARLEKTLKFLKSLENSPVMTLDGREGISAIVAEITLIKQATAEVEAELGEPVVEAATADIVAEASSNEGALPPIPPEEFIGPMQPKSNSEDPVD